MKTFSAEPEMLGRKDVPHGRWVVDNCNPRRGEPSTNIVDREMKAPNHDTELARVIRAHEMMHAKVSPAESMIDWINRKIATHESLVVAEELRVNYLCQKAGFNVKANLVDGGEMADGERIAATNDWKSAVHMAIATAGTASNKAFLTGVRRHNKKWAEILTDISKRAVKELKKVDKYGNLGSTDVDSRTGLHPRGFSNTERIAEWVDRLASITPEQEEEAEKAESASSSSTGESSEEQPQEKRGRGRPRKAGGHSNVGTSGAGSATGNPYKGITPSSGHYGTIGSWGELRIKRCEMPKHTKGNIGKKRTASNMGRSPRRIHRLLTDPEKRIFDKVTRGTGGVVVIDGSGSMSFTHDQIRRIVENAPGATVAVYTDKGDSKTNMWIVADKGKMVSELPDFGQGNGVDFPALEWAVKNRQRSSSPIVWVTDGGVCPENGSYNSVLAMQCLNFCRKHNIIILPYVEEAVAELKKMKNGNKGKSQYPPLIRDAYKELMGTPLV